MTTLITKSLLLKTVDAMVYCLDESSTNSTLSPDMKIEVSAHLEESLGYNSILESESDFIESSTKS